MRVYKLLLSIVAMLFLAPFSLWAQEEKWISKGDDFFSKKDFNAALDLYKQAREANPKNSYANLKLAQCHLLSRGKNQALQYASDALKYSPKPNSEIFFTLAEAFQINHQFDSAKFYFAKSDIGNNNKKLISKRIKECEFGKKYIANPIDAKISNAGELVNSVYQDYLPNITADRSKLYFTSRRPDSKGGKKEVDGRYFEDIYTCKNIGGAWSTSENIGAPLNSPIHDACIGLSDDGQTMFVYKGSNGGDIYMSTLKGNIWGTPAAMPINTEFFESTACLSPDERTLFFVRKVMDGSRDLYTCSKTMGGNWSKPRRLELSTEYDDDCPFMHPDGKTLYFCSKGHSSMGGYDVFKSVKNAKGFWGAPENLGFPINSAGDDVYFVLSADGKQGFYSSDKEGGIGQQDIYSIRMPVQQAPPELALLKGIVKDEKNNTPIMAEITITDNDSKEVVAQFHSNEQTGEYLVSLPSGRNYGIAVEKKGTLFYSENVFLSSKDGYKEINKEIKLASASKGSKVILKNIFFDSGQSDLKESSGTEMMRLAKLMKENPSIQIEICGYTDNVGDAALNLKLSQERAKKVADYLIANGIAKSRLKAIGYGSTMPLGGNEEESGRQKNRRTEFKIL